MTAYVVAQLRFTDIEKYRIYEANFPEVFARSNGKALCADEQPRQLEGNAAIDKLVVLQFPTEGEAMEFLQSPSYQEIAKDRHAGAMTTSFLVNGLNG